MKEVNTQYFLTFEIGTQEVVNVPIWNIVCFQQKKRQDSQNLNNDTFYRPPNTSAQCIVGTEKNPDSAIFLKYADVDYSQGYGQIKEAFRALTKVDINIPYISDHDLGSSNIVNDTGYSLYVFDIRYQRKLEKVQPNKVEFIFSKSIPAGIKC